jgi:hypothetical protein
MSVTENEWEDGGFTRYVRSPSDRIERVEDYDREGHLKMVIEYRYDDRGRNHERVVRDGSGTQIRRLTFEFTDATKEVIQREYDGNDTLVSTQTGKDT